MGLHILMRSLGSRWPRVALAVVLVATLGGKGAWARGAKAPPKSPGSAVTIPADTVLYVRLQTAVSTKTSKEGQAVTATVAREVTAPGGVAIPVGATVKGKIEKCAQSSRPDVRSELLLSFTEIDIPGEGSLKITGHVSGVSNARETLLADGTAVGVLETEAPATLLSGALAKLGAMSPDIQKQIDKQKIGQVNTAIEFPAGTDLQFTLTQPLSVGQTFSSTGPAQLPAVLVLSLQSLLNGAPQRAVSKDNKPGDPINLVFVGTAQEIEQAFRAADWSEPKRTTGQAVLDTAVAVINNDGYNAAPVSDLYLYGKREDLAFEKVLNTFNKRHHLRLWQTPDRASDGRPIWLGAATHDTGIDIHPGVVSHATDPNLDDERAQVEADLVAGGTVQALQLVSPPHPLTSGFTATGGAWHTDGRLLAVDVKTGAAAFPITPGR
ncbi:MAG TPA: LssY C-terminal domain-containing protein [Terriglobia bacterium]